MPRRNKTPPVRQPQTLTDCARKRRYISENEALEVAAYQMILKPELELGVYQCPHCGGWHLTNLSKS